MVQDRKHWSLLQLIDKIVSVPLGFTKEDLVSFRQTASRTYPAIVPLIDEYIRFAELSDTEASPRRSVKVSKKVAASKTKAVSPEMHLFDLLRERRLFPANADLAHFAARVLPNMNAYRFDKMSRGDIAGRIIEYLEMLEPQTREQLEVSMRQAMSSTSTAKPTDRKSFFSTWERIIKGTQF